MRRVNWNNVSKSAKSVKQSVKNLQAASEYLSKLPEEGYMLDNISKNVVKIKDCKSSSLRRYVSLLDKYYYLVNAQADRDMILEKKVEIEKELNTREDGIIDNN